MWTGLKTLWALWWMDVLEKALLGLGTAHLLGTVLVPWIIPLSLALLSFAVAGVLHRLHDLQNAVAHLAHDGGRYEG